MSAAWPWPKNQRPRPIFPIFHRPFPLSVASPRHLPLISQSFSSSQPRSPPHPNTQDSPSPDTVPQSHFQHHLLLLSQKTRGSSPPFPPWLLTTTHRPSAPSTDRSHPPTATPLARENPEKPSLSSPSSLQKERNPPDTSLLQFSPLSRRPPSSWICFSPETSRPLIFSLGFAKQTGEHRTNLSLPRPRPPSSPASQPPADPALSSLGLDNPFSWTSRQLVKTRQPPTLLHRFNPRSRSGPWTNGRICHQHGETNREEEGRPRTDLKKGVNCLLCFWFFFFVTAGIRRKKGRSWYSPPALWISRRRVDPPAASVGGEWRRRAATVPRPETFQHCSGLLCNSCRFFGFLFCNFWIVFDLFWIFVICFTCRKRMCKKKKKKRGVCLYFLFMLLNYKN